MFTLQGTGDELIRIEIENPVLLQMQNHVCFTIWYYGRSLKRTAAKLPLILICKQVKQATFKSSPTFNNAVTFSSETTTNSIAPGRDG